MTLAELIVLMGYWSKKRNRPHVYKAYFFAQEKYPKMPEGFWNDLAKVFSLAERGNEK